MSAETELHLSALQEDFEQQAGRSLSLPIAGAAVWTAVGVAAAIVPARTATFVLLFGTGAIFPVALGIARLLDEQLLSNSNPLARLMGACVFMVNLLWPVHLTVLAHAPEYVPLTLGIALGLHWVVFSWIVRHPVGIVHAVLRTLLVSLAWWWFPSDRIVAVAAAVVLAYGYGIWTLARRPLAPSSPTPSPRPAAVR